MDLRTALVQGTSLLEKAGVPVPRLTAEVLLCHALRCERSHLYAHPEAELSELGWIHYGRYLHERIEGKPTQYITKRQEFYGRSFHVSPSVLIPRPETEHVVAAALARIQPGNRIVDIGCGSGAIAVTLALESEAQVFGSDISADAINVASRNARSLQANVSFSCGDLTSAFASASFDMVVSNPPYVGLDEASGLQSEVRNWEPHVALFAGPDGADLYAKLIADAPRVLRPGGWIVLELGWRSLERVTALLEGRWTDVDAIGDLAGIPRVLCARLSR